MPPDFHALTSKLDNCGLLWTETPPAIVASAGRDTFVSAALYAMIVLLMLPLPGMVVRTGKLMDGKSVLFVNCNGPPTCAATGATNGADSMVLPMILIAPLTKVSAGKFIVVVS